MKRRAILAAAVVLAAGLGAGLPALLRGSGSDGSASFTDSAGQRWRVVLVATPGRAERGRPVEVRLTIANESRSLQSLSFRAGPQIRLRALDASGRIVWESEEQTAGVPISRAVAPSDSIAYRRSMPTAGLSPGTVALRGVILAEQLAGRPPVEATLRLSDSGARSRFPPKGGRMLPPGSEGDSKTG